MSRGDKGAKKDLICENHQKRGTELPRPQRPLQLFILLKYISIQPNETFESVNAVYLGDPTPQTSE